MIERILVTGASGLIGSAVVDNLRSSNHFEIFAPSSSQLNLVDFEQVSDYFSEHRPEVVINLAARVGGILANANYPVDFFESNVLIALNTYRCSSKFGVRRIINAGAGCGYPLMAPEPLVEETIWDGRPQPESIGYSTAKKLLILMGEIYESQHKIKSTTVIPSNVYGIHDNFSVLEGHVVPALIHKFYVASLTNADVEVWGDGSTKRDFIFAGDVARVISILATSKKFSGVVNVATGTQHSIRELVENISMLFKFQGSVIWNTKKPTGQDSRLMDISKLTSLLKEWSPLSLREGLQSTIHWFRENYASGKLRL